MYDIDYDITKKELFEELKIPLRNLEFYCKKCTTISFIIQFNVESYLTIKKKILRYFPKESFEEIDKHVKDLISCVDSEGEFLRIG